MTTRLPGFASGENPPVKPGDFGCDKRIHEAPTAKPELLYSEVTTFELTRPQEAATLLNTRQGTSTLVLP
jgi:hypothetical protein